MGNIRNSKKASVMVSRNKTGSNRLTYHLAILFYSKCYGKSLKSLGQGNTITGYIFLDHSDCCEDSRLGMRMEAGNIDWRLFGGSGEK